MLRYIIILLIASVALISCEEQINYELDELNSELIVVESVLTNENVNHLVRLSRPYDSQNMVPDPVSGAIIFIRTESDTYQALESPSGSGLYYTEPFIAVIGKVYQLEITFNNKTYTAFAGQPPVEPLENLSIKSVTDSTYAINFIETGTDPNYIKYSLDWQGTINCTTTNECLAKVIFYDLKNIDINKQFSADKEVVTFPLGTTIIRKKYSVSERYLEYLRGMLSETYWRGGLFDVYPANATTNLSDGAVGFFAVSSVVSDTTIIEN